MSRNLERNGMALVGAARHAIQCYLMAVNLKRLVKLLTGVSFKTRTKAYVTMPKNRSMEAVLKGRKHFKLR